MQETWVPELNGEESIKYVAICEAIARDISSHRLLPGQRLPTQRSLAKELGVTIGTIGRAYALAEKQGLVSLEVGRGSYVRDFPEDGKGQEHRPLGGKVDLGINRPTILDEDQMLSKALGGFARRPDLVRLMDEVSLEPSRANCQVAAGWLKDRIQCRAEDVLISSGARNAILATLAALRKPGQSVMTEAVSFPGLIATAKFLGVNLIPLEMDQYGILPQELEKKSELCNVLYCCPTNHNPTGTTVPHQRRLQLAAVAKRKGIYVIEDDVYGKLTPTAPPALVNHIPETGVLISSFAKTLAIGLRYAFIVCPPDLRQTILNKLIGSQFFTPPLISELICGWINDGTVDRVIAKRIREMDARQRVAKQILSSKMIYGNPTGNHLWLRLPPRWTSYTFQRAAEEMGVLVYPSAAFEVTGKRDVNAVRISLGGARNNGDLEVALQKLETLINEPAETPSFRY